VAPSHDPREEAPKKLSYPVDNTPDPAESILLALLIARVGQRGQRGVCISILGAMSPPEFGINLKLRSLHRRRRRISAGAFRSRVDALCLGRFSFLFIIRSLIAFWVRGRDALVVLSDLRFFYCSDCGRCRSLEYQSAFARKTTHPDNTDNPYFSALLRDSSQLGFLWFFRELLFNRLGIAVLGSSQC